MSCVRVKSSVGRGRASEAFTLLEVMIVVVIVGILAAVVVPQMASATGHAKSAAVQAGLAAVRSGIASHRTRMIISGGDPFPSLADLQTPGEVLQEQVPANPYTGLRAVQAVSASAAAARQVFDAGTFGWNYYVDNSADPPAAVFYCNSEDATEVRDGSGGFRTANQL